ncbi:polypeptide N-acetylgalactosaminyltransferase 5-like [Liolophura sinensis]|uniref:polypeptide N-acetylgalactosaminyltransferase 5-like n=1 Tax=Liolophura sinensis TaxID=3198878 RepID=UPI003158C527
MKSFKTITVAVTLVWLFGIFIFFQRPNLEEDLERLKQRFTTKAHVAIRNELKDARDADILRELVLRAASRDAFRKDILKHWRKEIEKDILNEGSNNLEKAGDSTGKKHTLREIPQKSLNQSDVGKSRGQTLPVDKTVAIVPEHQQRKQEASSNEDSYDPNAPGEGGKPVIIVPEKLSPEERAKYDLGWKQNAFNQYASDKISLHRHLGNLLEPECKLKTYRENLPVASVVIIFHNEAMSVLLRTVHSVLDASPPHLIKQIFLVDDCSDREELQKPLDEYLLKLPKVQVLRLQSRVGLIRARLHGFSHVTSEVAIFLDSHCECVEGWLEPLLDRIAENSKIVAVPVADIISADDFGYSFRGTNDIFLGGLDLDLNFSWRTIPPREFTRRKDKHEPLRTPTFLGCCFAISVDFFNQLGTYDDGFDIWGAEHLELSFKTWMCGGSLEYIPCSHVGHLFRTRSPYTWRSNVDALRRNNLRLAEVWMDEYKMFFYDRIFYKPVDYGDVSSRKQIRENLQCKSFDWYVKNIYPELYLPINSQATGMIQQKKKPLCLESSVQWFDVGKRAYMTTCNTASTIQHWTLTKENQIRRDENCLDISQDNFLVVKTCGDAAGSVWMYRQDDTIAHAQSGLCLEMDFDGKQVSMQRCMGTDRQLWSWERRRLRLPMAEKS